MNDVVIRNWVAVLVVSLWSIAGVVAFFTKNFEELGIMTPVMMIVVSFVFGYRSSDYRAPEHKEE